MIHFRQERFASVKFLVQHYRYNRAKLARSRTLLDIYVFLYLIWGNLVFNDLFIKSNIIRLRYFRSFYLFFFSRSFKYNSDWECAVNQSNSRSKQFYVLFITIYILCIIMYYILYIFAIWLYYYINLYLLYYINFIIIFIFLNTDILYSISRKISLI